MATKKTMKTLQDLADSLSKECYGMSLSEAQARKMCIACGHKVGEITKDEERVGYEISGLCPKCQNAPV